VYAGAFRVPQGDAGDPNGDGYSYGGMGIAYDPAKDGLFMVGHIYHNYVGEISIPQIVNSSNLNQLKTASVLQGLADITEGHLSNVCGSGSDCGDSVNIGGLLVVGSTLIGDAYRYYDANGSAKLSHFSSSTTVSTKGDFKGMFKLGSLNPGLTAGYMTQIPEEWQSALGGKALTGQAGIPIISRGSLGPSASVFNPEDVAKGGTIPATPVVGYPIDHPTLGTYEDTTVNPGGYNKSTVVTGIAFPKGTKTILFFGRQGLGTPCYGIGTADKSKDQQPTGEGTIYCYDPENSSKGTHGYPYSGYVWAYNVDDFIAVKNGKKQMWDIRPYAYWTLGEVQNIDGAAYDAARNRIYISEHCADPGGGYFCGPVVHAYDVK
jgi:hypothetical protein